MERSVRRIWRPAAWAGVCLLGLALAAPAQAQTGGGWKHRGGNPGSTGTGTGTTTGGAATGGTSSTPTSPGGGATASSSSSGSGGGIGALFDLFGSLDSLVQLTPQQELELMMQALDTVETLVTAIQIQDEQEVLFLFVFVYELYRFEEILAMLTGGATAGTTGG
jgi:hypothetical protein